MVDDATILVGKCTKGKYVCNGFVNLVVNNEIRLVECRWCIVGKKLLNV